MMKVSEIKDLIRKTVKEMSTVSGGTATVTGNGTGEQYFTPARVKKPNKAKTEVRDVEPKLAAGEVEDNYAVSHFGFTPAPSIPDRKSKAMDYKKIFEDGNVEPIQRAELIAKLAPLKDLPLKYKVNNDDISSLTFVSTKAEIMKIWKALGVLGVQDYFDPPVDDSEYSGRGTWAINAQEAIDNGLILSGIKEDSINENYAHFRSEAKTRTKPEQLHEAVKQIKKKLLEVNKLVEYTSRLRSEIAEASGEVKYKMHTERALEQIQEMIKHTYIKAKKLK